MLRIHSFLQSIYSYIGSISKKIYRTCAVVTTGVFIISVVALSSNAFGGGGKSRTAIGQTQRMEADAEEDEEVEADAKAKIQTETVKVENEAQSINVRYWSDKFSLVTAQKEHQLLPVTQQYLLAGAAISTDEKIEENETKVTETEVTETEAVQIMQTTAETEPVPVYGSSIQVTEYEYDILLHIVAAEAGGCDIKGQILVANVILNRVAHSRFPNSIEAVVFQKNQFSPVLNGTLWGTAVTSSVEEAVNRALAGEDYSQGALFFSARARLNDESMGWFDRNLTWLFEHDGHEFYTY